ncbi:MAG TPA: hypothetical protein VJK51_00940 [Candidatus Nanoarchaeia archaeon]|nr:hypothetical protein [Candidatus Nanoarchaeia archaeon]
MVYTDVAVSGGDVLAGGVLGGLIALIFAFILIFFLIMIGVYIYTSLAYMAIGKRARLKTPGLAWIPGVGPTILAFQTSKMHWWPWLLLIGFFIPFVNIVAFIAFGVFSVIWHWKLFERIGRPGWWALLQLIPIVGLVLIGIAAWGKQ